MGVTQATIVNVEKGHFGASMKVLAKFRDAKSSIKAGSMKAPRELKRVPR
jgi:hypothetical protein